MGEDDMTNESTESENDARTVNVVAPIIAMVDHKRISFYYTE